MTASTNTRHLFQDKDGTIHACESSEVHRGILLVWTKCKKDVPADKSFRSGEVPTCEKCHNLLVGENIHAA
jgi:hypothetical protein